MSTWISKALGAALILGLAACQLETGGLALPGQTRVASVLGGAMKVAAPSGYCVDKGSAQQQGDGAVVLIGRCNDRLQVPPAVISVTIGAAGSAGVMAGGPDTLAAFFTSPDGRAALSRSGDAASVRIVEATTLGDVFLLHIAETGAGDYWRAVLGLSGRLVTVSVQGPEGDGLEPMAGRRLVTATVSAMRSANAPI